ncbi:arylsulfatase [Methylocystis sp. ATCC 49242]|uniref:arylsulfatase n=1 Tax=Methylocystis sp. ATCC 49242 TaxID=622637 RepID=UPI0001F88091|nr:arylsulfatase [Methylocystis sp. ATCC 49242]
MNISICNLGNFLIILAFALPGASPLAAQSAFAPTQVVTPMDRTVLPIPEPQYPHSTVMDARNASPPPRFEVRAPTGAPNVLIVLIDDMGFGQSSAFGGPIHMPTVESLANAGLRYNQFHTTALCSPTRAALLSGRNHHMNNMGSITETATAFPGQTGQRPNSVAPLAEMLRLNGYSTAAFGKSHETAAWELSPSGPTDRWPIRSGFDKFYGFLGGETNQWSPLIYDGLNQIETPKDPNYHFMTDMTNQAVAWVRYQKSLTPDKPFFIYFAPGATHAPHHVPKEWIAKYKGKFDQGWDKLREETLERQKKLGVVPADTKLAPKPEAIKDWSALTADEKKLFARQMEVFAAFGEYADTEVGRLIDAIKFVGQLDDTLIFYIVGDNGASAEGGMAGLYNESTYFNMVPESVKDVLKHYNELGSPKTYNHYAAGWAVAGATPFTWTKQVASNYGGTRNGMVVHWPKGVSAKGEVRSQWHHVIDIAPTVLEAAHLPEPRSVNGTLQEPIEGVSLLYTFADAGAADRHTTQYFEMFGNRAIYHDGWIAGTVHRAPWEYQPRAKLEDDKWELYDTRGDFSLVNDLATNKPEKLKELQDLFMREAVKYSVLPIDDRTAERFNAGLVGRPDLMAGRASLTVYQGMTGISENAFINVKNRSHTINADVNVSKSGANGVILAQGGRFGGWSVYLKNGKPTYEYNFVGLRHYVVAAKQPLRAGRSSIRLDFDYDGGGLGKGGNATLYVNDEKVASGRVEETQCCAFSLEDGVDVGADKSTPVTETYKSPAEFTGVIEKVTVELKPGKKVEIDDAEKARKYGAAAKAIAD